MRISDWSSDVCSSDLKRLPGGFRETDLVPREELAIDLEERCGDRPTTVADIDLGVRSKAFSMTDRTVAPHDGDQLMMRVETQTACAREGRFDLAWDIEKVLRLQRSGAAAGRNLLHVAMTTFRAWEAAAFRSEEHTSELQSLMRISYHAFCLK